MSNRLYLAGVAGTASSGTTITIEEYPSNMDWPTELQLQYVPSLDGTINIQRRINDDRAINIMFSNVKEREEIMSGVVTNQVDDDTFDDSSMGGYVNDTFNNYYVKFDSDTSTSAIRGEERKVSDFTTSTGRFDLSSAFSAAPAVGDTYKIYRKTAWLDSLLANRYVLTDYKFDIQMESGYTHSILPDGITSQRVIIVDVVKRVVPNSQEQNIYNVTLVLRKVVT
jgi:hypothetical protein